jgi:hypothetical protein
MDKLEALATDLKFGRMLAPTASEARTILNQLSVAKPYQDINSAWACEQSSHKNANICRTGAQKPSLRWLLVGDSHAGMWSAAARRATKLVAGLEVTKLWVPQCANSLSLAGQRDPKTYYAPEIKNDCQYIHSRVLSAAKQLKPDVIIFSDDGALQGPDAVREQAWLAGYTAFIDAVEPYANQVVVLGHTPRYPKPSECLDASLSNLANCGTTTAATQIEARGQQRIARASGAKYVDTVDWLCNSTCPLVIDGTVVSTDGGHITSAIGIKLAPLLVARLVK